MKKGILVVSFGTSYPETLTACIASIEGKIAMKFPEFEVRRAFTSRMIVKKIKDRDGIHINNTEEALKEMLVEGFTEILVQPLHIIPGYEYDKVKRAVAMARHQRKAKILLGSPLLNHHEDYLSVIDGLENQLPVSQDKKGILLMGHGTHHHANASYVLLERLIRERRSDVHLANVEGYPELEDIISSLEGKYDAMTLIPFMLVAGDHAKNDMAGDEEDSFKSQLNARGIKVDCHLVGLGENPSIQEIFVNKIKELIEEA